MFFQRVVRASLAPEDTASLRYQIKKRVGIQFANPLKFHPSKQSVTLIGSGFRSYRAYIYTRASTMEGYGMGRCARAWSTLSCASTGSYRDKWELKGVGFGFSIQEGLGFRVYSSSKCALSPARGSTRFWVVRTYPLSGFVVLGFGGPLHPKPLCIGMSPPPSTKTA